MTNEASHLPSSMPAAVLGWMSLGVAVAFFCAVGWDRMEMKRDLDLAGTLQDDLIPKLTLAHLKSEDDGFAIRVAQLGATTDGLLYCLPFQDTHSADDARPLRPDRRILTPGPSSDLLLVADAACRKASGLRRAQQVSA